MSSCGWLLLSFCAVVYGQDPFEIVIFEYEPEKLRRRDLRPP
jgi:hypothetical protein